MLTEIQTLQYRILTLFGERRSQRVFVLLWKARRELERLTSE